MTFVSALADEMARTAVLHGGINLGTNDLTQPALGIRVTTRAVSCAAALNRKS